MTTPLAFLAEPIAGVSKSTQEIQMNGFIRFAMSAACLGAAFVLAQTVAAANPLPPSIQPIIQADRTTIHQDQINLENAIKKLSVDETAHNEGAIASDRTAIDLARLQLAIDQQKLRQDALPVLQSDQSALLSALTQLYQDQLHNSTGALTGDQLAVEQAEAQLKSDHKAIFGGLGRGRATNR
jgi:hypothetical protein